MAAEPLEGEAAVWKVLLVEDNDMVRAVTRRILTRGGFVVAAAVDATDALQQCELTGFDVDLVITDIEMPGMSGTQLAERIRLVRPGLRILFISGHPEERVLRDGVLQAGAAFLEKPFTPNELLEKAREVLSAR